MRPDGIVELDPLLGCPQELSQGLIAAAFSYRELEQAHEPFRIPIICGSAGPTHGKLEALLQQELPGWFRSELFALTHSR